MRPADIMTSSSFTNMTFGEVCRRIAMARTATTPAVKAALTAVLSATSLQSAIVIAARLNETTAELADMDLLSSSIVAIANSLEQCAERLDQTVSPDSTLLIRDSVEACLQTIRLMAELAAKAEGIVGLHNQYAYTAASDCAGTLLRSAETVADIAGILTPQLSDRTAAQSADKEIDYLLNKISASCTSAYKAINTLEKP